LFTPRPPFASEVRTRGYRGGSRTSEAGHQCRRFEVPTPPAASSFRNLKSKSGTRIICLLVPLLLPKFVQEDAAVDHELRKRGTSARRTACARSAISSTA